MGYNGFVKISSNIIQSSIMLESPEVFKCWITILAACDCDGIARISPVFLMSVCHLDKDTVLNVLKILESPDDLSRTKEEDGRRIKAVDGGYMIINYQKYRDWTYSNNPESVRKRKQRSGTQTGHVPDTLSSVICSSSSSEEECEKGNKKKKCSSDFVVPNLDEVKEFFKANGFPESLAEQFHKSYDVANWFDSRGNKIRNWKQKAIQVWFKNDGHQQGYTPKQPEQPSPYKKV